MRKQYELEQALGSRDPKRVVSVIDSVRNDYERSAKPFIAMKHQYAKARANQLTENERGFKATWGILTEEEKQRSLQDEQTKTYINEMTSKVTKKEQMQPDEELRTADKMFEQLKPRLFEFLEAELIFQMLLRLKEQLLATKDPEKIDEIFDVGVGSRLRAKLAS